MCYIQICVIMRCVIKGLHCVLNFCPLDFFPLSNSADQDEMLHSVYQDTKCTMDWYISFATQVLVVISLINTLLHGLFSDHDIIFYF